MPSFVYFEDDAMSRQVMNVMLTREMGYTDVVIVPTTDDFEGVLARCPSRPDVIFLDIHIQPVGRVEVLKALRASGQWDNTRIVALTASVMNEEVDTLRQAGFDGVIGKPIDADTFPTFVNRILNGERVWRPT